METPKLIVDRDISAFDVFAEMFGDAQPVFSANLVTDFLDANKDATEIEVEIRSDGGSTSEARVIYDLLKNCGKKVITKGYKVNSSAVMIFLAGDERLIAENADFLIHPVWIDAMGLPWMLTGEDLQTFADEIKAEESKMLDLYFTVIGEENKDEVSQLMADSTNLSNDKAVELGFATGKLEEQGAATENKRAVTFSNKIAAIVLKNKQSNKNKDDIMKGLKETLENINATLKNFVNKDEEPTPENNETPETQNASVELAEGGSLYYDGELAEGVAVFTDEVMESPAPDGDHALADGRVVSVADGSVSAVAAASAEEPTPEDKDENGTQNTDVDELKNKIESIEETQAAQTESLNTIAETLQNMGPAFDALKNLVPGDTGGESTPTRERKIINKELSAAEYNNLSAIEKKRYNQSKK